MTSLDQRIQNFIQLYRLKRRLSDAGELEPLRSRLLRLREEARLEFRSRAGRLWDAQFWDQAFASALADQVEHGRDPAVTFALAEATKSRTLLDQEARRVTAPVGAARDLLTLEKEALRFARDAAGDLVGRELRLASYIPAAPSWDDPARDAVRRRLEEAYADAGAGFVGAEPPIALRDLQERLAPGELMVEFCLPYTGFGESTALHALCISRDAFTALSISLASLAALFPGWMAVDGKPPVDGGGLAELVVLARANVQSGHDAAAVEALQRLYALTIEPLVRAGFDPERYDRWIVIPSGRLHAVPFGALLDAAGTPLIERVSLVMAPSATLWARAASRPVKPLRKLLAFANPAFAPGLHLDPLVESEDEVRTIAELLGELDSDIYVGAEATESRLVSRSGSAHIIHLATHATFPEQDAIDLHRVALAPGGAHDGELRVEDLRELDLRHVALVVLSVCNGGIYRFGPGDEMHGLAAACLAAGARNVLATMWSIGDAAGREFVTAFYRRVLSHGPAAALRLAALERRAAGAPIVDWASFVLIGDGRALDAGATPQVLP